jgi:hypothetical protein
MAMGSGQEKNKDYSEDNEGSLRVMYRLYTVQWTLYSVHIILLMDSGQRVDECLRGMRGGRRRGGGGGEGQRSVSSPPAVNWRSLGPEDGV